MEEKIGIWIDKKKAFIITLKGSKHKVKQIVSTLESYNPKGGHRSKTPWGPVDTVKEKSFQAREDQQKKDFLKEIIRHIKNKKFLFLFGPAQMKNELKKFIEGHHGMKPDLLMCDSADSMTVNQMVAETRDAFHQI